MSRNFELLQQVNKEQDLFENDYLAKAAKIAHLRRAEAEQDLFRPLIIPAVPIDGSVSPDLLPRGRQRVVFIGKVAELLKSYPRFLYDHLVQLPSQTRKLLRQRAVRQGISSQLGYLQSFDKGTLAQATLVREEEIKLIQRVFLSPSTEAPRTVVFSGVEHGNGSSWVCFRASQTLASQVRGEVCVVDANLRSPSLHRYFGLTNDNGLVEALSQSVPLKNYAYQLPESNLWVLTAGSSSVDPYPLLTSEKLQSGIRELQKAFRYVLIDAPPVIPYSDAAFLGQMADGVVLVMEANTTHREAAEKAKERLEKAHSRVLAAVLNKRTFPIPEGIYRKL